MNCGGRVYNSVGEVIDEYDIVIDAVFGFGFSGHLRSPFNDLIHFMNSHKHSKLVSIDVPSGWKVDCATQDDNVLQPDMLVSLTAPKKCAVNFSGQYHVLGGRFVPL